MIAPSTFGALLRQHRLSAGLTQEELADLAGLSARTIADLERGARRFPYPIPSNVWRLRSSSMNKRAPNLWSCVGASVPQRHADRCQPGTRSR
jgi:DNA-binding XRE family transcriptional regulator